MPIFRLVKSHKCLQTTSKTYKDNLSKSRVILITKTYILQITIAVLSMCVDLAIGLTYLRT